MKKLYLTLLNSVLIGVTIFIPLQVNADDIQANETLPYYDSAEFTPKWMKPDNAALQSFHRIPNFSFTNQDGEIITQKNLDNKIYVANFFFSTCPGICPAIKSKLINVQKKFLDDDNVSLVSYSIRPTTDTVEILKEYAKQNGIISGKWHLLTGDKEAIYSLAKNAYYANEDLGNAQNNNDFLHTENIVLIDENKNIRGIYNGLNSTSISNLITDIEILKNKS